MDGCVLIAKVTVTYSTVREYVLYVFLKISKTWLYYVFWSDISKNVIHVSESWLYYAYNIIIALRYALRGLCDRNSVCLSVTLVDCALYGKRYYRVLIGNHTLAFDWCHFWWPWSTFEGHFSLGCHFHVHFSNLCLAFASRGLPAVAELLVLKMLIINLSVCLSHSWTVPLFENTFFWKLKKRDFLRFFEAAFQKKT